MRNLSVDLIYLSHTTSKPRSNRDIFENLSSANRPIDFRTAGGHRGIVLPDRVQSKAFKSIGAISSRHIAAPNTVPQFKSRHNTLHGPALTVGIPVTYTGDCVSPCIVGCLQF